MIRESGKSRSGKIEPEKRKVTFNLDANVVHTFKPYLNAERGAAQISNNHNAVLVFLFIAILYLFDVIVDLIFGNNNNQPNAHQPRVAQPPIKAQTHLKRPVSDEAQSALKTSPEPVGFSNRLAVQRDKLSKLENPDTVKEKNKGQYTTLK